MEAPHEGEDIQRKNRPVVNLNFVHCNPFASEDHPDCHVGQMLDGRRVHTASMPCKPGELHWAGNVKDPDAYEATAPVTVAR